MVRKTYPDDVYIFQSESNNSKSKVKAWSRSHTYNVINKIARKHGITDKIGNHTLRKTFGYHAHKSGICLTLLQKIFNHSMPSTTLSYIGITQDNIDDVYLKMEL